MRLLQCVYVTLNTKNVFRNLDTFLPLSDKKAACTNVTANLHMYSCKHPFSWPPVCVFLLSQMPVRAELLSAEDKLQLDVQLLSSRNQPCKRTSRAHWITLPCPVCVCLCVCARHGMWQGHARGDAVCWKQCAELSRAGPSQGGPQVWLWGVPGCREGGRLWGRGGRGRGGLGV